MKSNRVTELFGIEYPVIAGGMVWCSGWRLAAAVSNAGGLGLLGAGSMHPETLIEHIDKMNAATTKPWGINVPLMYPEIEKLMDIIIEKGVKIVFTSAGSPKKFTARLHEAGIKVAHVVSSSKFAKKCEEAGVDAVVAEGFEAGGHNGREETTTMALIPQVREAISLPLIAAGGIGSGKAMLAAMALGAEGVQIGTLFAVSEESSASDAFKQMCVNLGEDGTMLALKKISPTRLIKNELYAKIAEAESRGAEADELRELLGKAASKRGIFEGDLENGELEIGQIVSAIKEVQSVSTIMKNLIDDFTATQSRIAAL
ncbi:MAG: nitronate monooxygenase [bacterium]|nr:nitronate monooxygenase [bacterium]